MCVRVCVHVLLKDGREEGEEDEVILKEDKRKKYRARKMRNRCGYK